MDICELFTNPNAISPSMPHKRSDYDPEQEPEAENGEERTLAKAALRSRRPWYNNAILMWATQGVIVILLGLILGYVTLWMDTHNDARYIPRPEYKRDEDTFLERYKDNREVDRKDRESIRQASAQDKVDLSKRLDRQESQLDTIAQDIKSLLRRNP